MMFKYYIAYEDKGPSGACGQSVKSTAPWNKLYIFNDEAKARKFMVKVVETPLAVGRLRPRITGFWSDDPSHDNVVEVK